MGRDHHLFTGFVSLREDVLDIRVLVIPEACDQLGERLQCLVLAAQLVESQRLAVER